MINRTVLMSSAQYFDDTYAINAYMNSHIPVNVGQAIKEHAAIREALESAGVKVQSVDPPANCQDGVYTANWALVRGDVAVMSHLPNKRQDEETYAEKVLRDLGKKIIHLPDASEAQASSSWAFYRRGMERAVSKYSEVNPADEKRSGADETSSTGSSAIRQAGWPGRLRFSGQGDALPCGNYLFMGSEYRTDLAAHAFIGQALGYEVISLQTIPKRRLFGFGPRVINKQTGWPDSYYYDLDLALAVLKGPENGQKGLIAWCPEVFTRSSREKLRKFNGVEKIEVSRHEATKGLALNLVSTGETVIMSNNAPKFRAELESRGLKTITPNVTELRKGGGFIRCTSLTLDND